MAKLIPSIKTKIEVENENGKVTKTFHVTFKELTRKENKKLGKNNEEILKVFTGSRSLIEKAVTLKAKLTALQEEEGNGLEVIKVADKLESIYDEQDKYEEEFEKLGGMDKLFEASKLVYEASVGGKDKDALAEFTEIESEFSDIIDLLRKDAQSERGKRLSK